MGALARASTTSAGTIDWNFLIGDPALDVGHTTTFIIDFETSLSDDYYLEIASLYGKQY